MGKDKKVERLNVLVGLQIFAWSTSLPESRAKSLVDLATNCSSTEMFSCPSFFASFMIVQGGWERGTRFEAVGTVMYHGLIFMLILGASATSLTQISCRPGDSLQVDSSV